MNLYDLTNNQKTLALVIDEYAIEHDGDITEISDLIDEWTAEYSTNEKIEAICGLIKEFTAIAQAREKISNELKAKAITGYERAHRLKQWLLLNIELSGKTNVDAGIYSVSIRTASKASLIIDKPIEEIPEKYIKTSLSIIRSDLEKAIKNGDNEALLLAHFAEKTKFIVIS